jgi:hypothetical protein
MSSIAARMLSSPPERRPSAWTGLVLVLVIDIAVIVIAIVMVIVKTKLLTTLPVKVQDSRSDSSME